VNNSVRHKVALVTGAGSGIGRAVALRLQAADYLVFAAGRRAAELQKTADLSLSPGVRIIPALADVSNPDAVRELFAEILRVAGRLDVLFNNAGIGAPAVPFEDISFDQWTAVVNVNLTGVFLCAQQAFRLMKEQSPRGGRIINNGSLSAHSPRPNSAPYTATKHAITGLTKSLSLDGRKYDIACGQIDIGNAATEMTVPIASGALQADGSILGEPRIDVGHVSDAVLYMAGLPLDTNVQFITLMATTMPFIGRG